MAEIEQAVGSGDEWSQHDVSSAVDSYLSMLNAELEGRPYSKSESRRSLLARLRSTRSEASVEFKYANISAVLIELGLPYIRGYKPRGNYQEALATELRQRLDGALIAALRHSGATEMEPGVLSRGDGVPARRPHRRKGRVIDYGALQEENRRLGSLGESLVVAYERADLGGAGRADLAARVRWASRDDGDGLGYDVLSFRLSGEPKHIEVKTTRLGAETPFYLSASEIAFGVDHPDSFVIYRVYDVGVDPRFFAVAGDPHDCLTLEPVVFRATAK